jgi:transposase
MRKHGSPQELERVRREAVALRAQGLSAAQVAAALDRSPRTVHRWLAEARQHGIEALAARPHAGAKPKLSRQQREGLRKQLLKGATAHGFDTDLWTADRVRQVIRQRYGVEYHVNYVPELLKHLGFSRQRPVRKAREQNEVEGDRWKRATWRRIKKKPGTLAPPLFSGMKAVF